ncbi:MAG: exodeoxyribonuclease VII small subunit [Candidatus Ancillula sp.]|jgi:exodeoxyribonuclease VII small subunit|nr:exodeoxyribonuclease VII small subunit [Candidatus Ancillula sp.]
MKSEKNTEKVLGYEDARKKLLKIVNALESEEDVNLEESLKLWEEGNALASYCKKYLEEAQKKLEEKTKE